MGMAMADSTSSQVFKTLLDNPPNTSHIAKEIRIFETLDSTNSIVLNEGHEGLLVIADQQTAGRGRLQRSWHSPPGKGLWFTVCLDGLVQGLTFAAALAVQDALGEKCPGTTIKWPNDILLDGKKICGILVEHKNDRMALGIGLNVNHCTEDFPDELQKTAGSLDSLTNISWNRVVVLTDILNHLDNYIELIRNGKLESVRSDWSRRCGLVGKQVQIGDVLGVVECIDEIGAIIIQTTEGTKRIMSGEIEIANGEDT